MTPTEVLENSFSRRLRVFQYCSCRCRWLPRIGGSLSGLSFPRSQSVIFPVGTLVVNGVGCFLIGLVSAYVGKHYPANSGLLLFLSTGMIGGFTTFSAFGLETVALIQGQQLALALLNILLNLTLGLGAVWAGRWIP